MSERQAEYKIEGRPATIFRTVKNKDNPYAMVDMRPILNENLSWKAKGLLTYLVSRPDGWEVCVSDLVKRSTDGAAAVRSALKELRNAGHMRYSVSRDGGRFTGWHIEVYELPQIINPANCPDDEIIDETALPPDSDNRNMVTPTGGVSPEVEKPLVEKPLVEKPLVDNRTQVLKTLSSNDSKKLREREKPDFVNMTVQQAAALPEMRIFRDATGRIPGCGQWETVWATIRGLNGRGSAEYLRPFWLEWSNRGWSASNLAWLTEWAVEGVVPPKDYHKMKPDGKKQLSGESVEEHNRRVVKESVYGTK